jgi:hypothetical protein
MRAIGSFDFMAEHAEHVHEDLAGDRDRELGRPGEVRLRGLTRPMLLRKDDVLVRTTCRAPHPDPALQRPQLPRLVSVGVLLHEQLEEGLRLERRRLDQPRLDLRPVLGEGVLPSPPVALLDHLRRQLAGGDVLARCLPIHSGSHRRHADVPVFAHLFHQSPHLRVGRCPHAACLSIPWRAGARPTDRASKDGAI